MWVESAVGSLLAPKGFLRLLRFSTLLKSHHFQFPNRSGTHGHVKKSSEELLSDLGKKLHYNYILGKNLRFQNYSHTCGEGLP